MAKNYLLTAIRNILRNRAFSIINIAGLSIGIACVILIMLWVKDEVSYDRFHKNGSRIFRVITKFRTDAGNIWTTSPFPLGSYMADKYPDVDTYTRYYDIGSLVKYEDKVFYENYFKLVDQSFLEMFSFEFIKGNKEEALKSKNSVVITESIARKYFGESDPVGKVLTINKSEFLTVTGVMLNPPGNTIFRFSMLANMDHIPDERLRSWAFDTKTFIQLKEGVSKTEFQTKIDSLYRTVIPNSSAIPCLQNIKDVYLNESGKPGRLVFVKVFSVTAMIILLLACINYMNLNTARSMRRSKEIGLRKVTGAGKSKIVLQFIGESLLLTLISMIIAMVLVELSRPAFNDLVAKDLHLNYGDPLFILGMFLILIITGFVSGLYPAVVLSSFSPIKTLKGEITTGKPGKNFINTLVVFQFTIAVILIIITMIIAKQIRYMNNKDLGLNKDNILVIPVIPDLVSKFDAIKNEILLNPSVVSVTGAYNLPTDHNSYVRLGWEGNEGDQGIGVFYNMTDYDFVETMGMEMVAGRSFSRDFADDDSISYIINESAQKAMNIMDPIGLPVEFVHPYFPERLRKGIIIGVVKDFHLRPLREKVVPFVMRMYRPWYNFVLIKYNTGNIKELVNSLEGIAKKYAPGYQFSYSLFDQEIKDLYMIEYKVGKIISYFTILSIVISCLGLLGLTIHELEQKTKEIGIRKVNGASTKSLIFYFSISFSRRILLSFFFAGIFARIITDKILQQYAYRTEVTIWLFLVAFAIALLIALLTIISQTYLTAAKNPVESLRYE